MFKSKQKRHARRAAADTTWNRGSGKMSLCRACLVLLKAEDMSHDLHNERDLALKFLACTGSNVDALPLSSQDETSQIVLKCICECCYELVQKFHDFQRMCEESLQNFEKLLCEASPKDNDSVQEEQPKIIGVMLQELLEDDDPKQTQLSIQDENELEIVQTLEIVVTNNELPAFDEIEEVYIIEDEQAKKAQAKNFIAAQKEEKVSSSLTKNFTENLPKRARGNRITISCNICTQRFYKTALYEAHMKKHKGEKTHTCVHCGKSYARANILDAHLREVHANTKECYSCSYEGCEKVYGAQRSLKLHIDRHHSNKPHRGTASHMCDKCGKSFTSKSHLTRHQWVHTNRTERPFECIHCKERFYTKQFLADHLVRKHSNLQLLRCKSCGRLMKSRLALAAHTKKFHSKRSSFKCDACQITFTTISNLRAHQRVVHAGIKRYGCSFCERSFAKKQHVELHEMRHTGERPYKCVPCKRGFIQKENYERHMREHKRDFT